MAGYSGTPLVQKLGIKPGAKLGLSHAPPGFKGTLGALPAGARASDAARAPGPFDVLVAFFSERNELGTAIADLAGRIDPNGALWIAWPKKASGVKTDVSEDTVRQVALPLGLVDNKVCAVDEVWSGLRLVWRLSERPKRSPQQKRTRSSAKQSSQPGRRPSRTG